MTPPQLLTYVVSNMRKWLWHVAAFVRGKPWKYQSGYPTNPFHFTHARACVHACFPFFFLSFFLSSPPFSFLFFSFLFFSFLFFSFLFFLKFRHSIVMLQDLGEGFSTETQQMAHTGPAHSVHSKTIPCWTSARHARCHVCY